MGGVDVHDQLRLQRFSIQLAFRFQKYYKSLFFGLVDLALVNAYIVYREATKKKGETPMLRRDFMVELHKTLLDVKHFNFEEDNEDETSTPTATSSLHVMALCEDIQESQGQKKRRQRSCKVCSLLRTDADKRTWTRCYCKDCSQGTSL
jgi:hypothetical protein